MHSETGPVLQNPIQRTVRTAHLSVLMTVQGSYGQGKSGNFDRVRENRDSQGKVREF